MAKGRSVRRGRRDANAVSNRSPQVQKQHYHKPTNRLHPSPSFRTNVADSVLKSLSRTREPSVTDGRVWPHQGARPAYDVFSRPVTPDRVVDAPRVLKSGVRRWGPSRTQKKAIQAKRSQINRWGPQLDRQTKAIRAFSDPKRVLVCIGRAMRKEVLHAIGVAGARGLRRPRRGRFSDVRC